ncbi:hypothetical protein U1839_26365 [Sphingomonas sp. RT2P30]
MAPDADDAAVAAAADQNLYARAWAAGVPTANRALEKCVQAQMGYSPFGLFNRCSFPVVISLSYGEKSYDARTCEPLGSVERARIEGGESFKPPVSAREAASPRTDHVVCISEVRYLAMAERSSRPRDAKTAQSSLSTKTAGAGGQIAIAGRNGDGSRWSLRRRIVSTMPMTVCRTRIATSDTTLSTGARDQTQPILRDIELDWSKVTKMDVERDRIALYTAGGSWTASYDFLLPSASAAREAAAPMETLILRC